MPTASRPETTLQRIFREVIARADVSARDLGRILALKTSTIGEKLRELEKRGVVEWRAHRGRWCRVTLNPAFGCVAGIDMGASNLRFALADFRGELLTTATERITPEEGPRKMIARIHQGIRTLVDAAPSDKNLAVAARRPSVAKTRRSGGPRLKAIAIGVPSPADPERGVVAFANNLPGWKNIHLGRELEKEFRVPVFLENDANMAAIGEHWRGVARGVNNFVFVALGTGIGSGIFVDGKLYRGRTGNAGELYRMNVEWQRWADDFGDMGYFEAHVSGLGIAAAGRRALDHSATGRRSVAPPSGGLVTERDAQFVFDAFRRDDAKATAVLERIFTILGVGVANLVSVLDPDLIAFGGGLVKGAPDLLLRTVERVVGRIHPGLAPPLRLSSLADKAQTYGAIASALSLAYQAASEQLGIARSATASERRR